MVNSEKYIRINRFDLLSDSNLTKIGSVRNDIINPSGWNLFSRIGGNLDEVRSPLPGYCISFNKSNPNAYIQTAIPSIDRDLYEIIIKGEGNIDLLYVDTAGENITIRQKQTLDDSSSLYFNLSYIVFKDTVTNQIIHLFECEESSGTILYDATSNGNAILSSVDNISAMRITSTSKEYIKNENNLYNSFKGLNQTYAYFNDAKSRILPSIFTIVADIKFDCTYNEFKSNNLISYIFGKPASTQDNFLYFYKRNSNLVLNYKTNNTTEISRNISETNAKLLFDKSFHKIILSFGANAVNLYFDSTLIATIIRTTVEGFGDESLSAQTSNINLCGPNNSIPIIIKGFDIFNYDVLQSSIYGLTDINSGKQIPSDLLRNDETQNQSWVSLRNMSNGYWLDQSINNRIVILHSTNMLNFPHKKYGTFLNAVGYTYNNNVYIPRKVLN